MHEAGHPKPVLGDNPEGEGGEAGRRGNEKQWGGVASTCWKPMQGWEVKDRK